MALSAIIITAERNTYVDFTVPFMDMGLDILMAKEKAEADIFYFFRPFRYNLFLVKYRVIYILSHAREVGSPAKLLSRG